MRGRRFCVLVSGRGNNLRALQAACRDGRIDGHIGRVVSNRADAAALDFARAEGIDTAVVEHRSFATREAFDAALAAAVADSGADWLLLAGFMRILGAAFVARWQGRALNIHPSLLPAHRGLHTHRAVLAAAEREHGASVHFVTDALDGGPVAIQGACSVRPDDDEASLAERVQRDIELRIYPQAASWVARGWLSCDDGGQVHFRGSPLRRPLTLDDLEEGF